MKHPCYLVATERLRQLQSPKHMPAQPSGSQLREKAKRILHYLAGFSVQTRFLDRRSIHSSPNQ